ncbi:transposase [Methylobacterium durans]|uniref:transposase n=1 Tax=Methylobacterium durans TaxID=2202825 RepID=UPI001F0256CD|nr:transposase [Methylobacterium durans]
MPARRPLQSTRPSVAGAASPARRRSRYDPAVSARVRCLEGGPRHARSCDQRGHGRQPVVCRLLTVSGINVTAATGLAAAIDDVGRFSSQQKLVSYFGLNPARASGLGLAQHTGASARLGAAAPVPCWSRPPGPPQKLRVRFTPSPCACAPGAVIRSRPRASSPCSAGTC